MAAMLSKGCVLQPSKVYLTGTPGVLRALGHIVLHDVAHKCYGEMQTTSIAAKPCSESREGQTITRSEVSPALNAYLEQVCETLVKRI